MQWYYTVTYNTSSFSFRITIEKHTWWLQIIACASYPPPNYHQLPHWGWRLPFCRGPELTHSVGEIAIIATLIRTIFSEIPTVCDHPYAPPNKVFFGDQPSTTNACGKSCFENSGSFIFHFHWTKMEPGYPQFDIIWDLPLGWLQILGTWIWSSIFISYVAQRNLDTSKLLLLAGWYEEVSANIDGIARSLRVHTLYQCLQFKTSATCQDWYQDQYRCALEFKKPRGYSFDGHNSVSKFCLLVFVPHAFETSQKPCQILQSPGDKLVLAKFPAYTWGRRKTAKQKSVFGKYLEPSCTLYGVFWSNVEIVIFFSGFNWKVSSWNLMEFAEFRCQIITHDVQHLYPIGFMAWYGTP